MGAPRKRLGCSIQETGMDSGKCHVRKQNHKEHIEVCPYGPYGQQICIVS